MNSMIDILKQNSLKVTSQRVTILEIIEKYGHITTAKLYSLLKEIHPSISLNTVYLNIEKLTSSGILTAISIDGDKTQYEMSKNDHIHLICKRCFCVEDLELPKNISNSLLLNSDFTKQRLVVNIYGICQRCKRRGNCGK